MGVVINVIENPNGVIEFWITDFLQKLNVPKPKNHKNELFADTVQEGFEIAFEVLGWPEYFPGIKDMPMVWDLRRSENNNEAKREAVVVDENEYRGPIISIS